MCTPQSVSIATYCIVICLHDSQVCVCVVVSYYTRENA